MSSAAKRSKTHSTKTKHASAAGPAATAATVPSGIERGVRRWRGHLLPLAVSALLLGLAYPAPGWGWLAHIALVPAAVVAVRSVRLRRLMLSVAVVFGVWWLVMLRWLIPVTLGGYVALSLTMMVYWLLALLGLRWLHRRYRSAAVLALPLVWVSMELVRAHFPAGGFSWFLLGHTQASYTPEQGAGRLVQVADLFGVFGVSFLVAMTNGLIVDLLTRPLLRRSAAGGLRPRRTIAVGVIVWLAAMIGSWGYGQYRIGQYAAATTPGPRVAVVQTNVPQSNKNQPTAESQQRDWQELLTLTTRAARGESAGGGAAGGNGGERPDLIVWPETVVPVVLNPEGRSHMRSSVADSFHKVIGEVARAVHVPLVVGAQAYEDFHTEQLGPGRQEMVPRGSYNSAFLYQADGVQAPVWYNKIQLVPFGEYVPWIDVVPGLKGLFIRYLTPYDFDYTLDAGTDVVVFDVPYGGTGAAGGNPDLRSPPEATHSGPASAGRGAATQGSVAARRVLHFATPICFEDTISRLGRDMVYDDAGRKRVDMLVNLTNDGWFAGHAMREQQLQIATLRTIENRVPMARSVNTGLSGFIDSLGRVKQVVEVGDKRTGVAGVAMSQVRLDARRTMFGEWGELPTLITALVTLGLVIGGWWRDDKIR